MKKKAIRAELRKESETFPGYFKYDLDIQYEDGTVERHVPAYGKDLQDALHRTVKKNKVEKVENTLSSIPNWTILLSWFLYLGGISTGYAVTNNGSWLIGGLMFPFLAFLGVQFWANYKTQK